MRSFRFSSPATLLGLFLILFIAGSVPAAHSTAPITAIDTIGKTIHLKAIPTRIVSLVPGATETAFALGAGDLIVGLTSHDTRPAEANTKTIVGGYGDPSPELVAQLQPEVIFVSRLHKGIQERFAHSRSKLVQVDARSVEDGFKVIALIGTLTGKNKEAAAKISAIRGQLDVIAQKVAKIPEARRKRVMRIMGSDSIMTPGDDSFQNQFIACAGAIPPSFGKSGQVVSVTQEEWVKFNPQLIYYCGSERKFVEQLSAMAGWNGVEAVKNHAYADFPCDLTCRASIHMGDFVSWLASLIYPDELCAEHTRIAPDRVLQSRAVTVDLPYVKSARVINGTMHDFPFQTLCVDFSEPTTCLNSLAGSKSGITTVANHYSSPPLWTRLHRISLSEQKEEVCRIVGRDAAGSSFLFTGAKMDGLSVQKTQCQDMVVYALVTAGVRGNAIRSAVDEGLFHEPGTINMIILTNMRLTPRAQTRAIISATEAKSSALQDLDIRSSFSPQCQATGTGTDEIVVVQGSGRKAENTGGHSKMGELIAKAVYAAVKEAISRQNGLTPGRSVFQRIEERGINLYDLVAGCDNFPREERARVYHDLQALLLEPAYAGFLESACALSAAYDTGLVSDIQSFQETCDHVCTRISGCASATRTRFVAEGSASKPICLALDALLSGLFTRCQKF
jgi:iron complex transport system substrate-binding protein